MLEAPAIRWIGSPNFRREVTVKRGVVFHWIVGYLAAADARFVRPNQTATQYGVGPDAIHQYVEDQYRAPGTGHNGANISYISIEHEAGYLLPDGSRHSGAPATLENSARLVAHLSRKHGWGKMVPGVNAFGHRQFVATMCPGTLPWAWICDRANEINGQQDGVAQNPGTTPAAGVSVHPFGTYNGYSIKAIQKIVGAVEDSSYGPDTTARVRAWQTANGLKADGIVGPITWARMTGAPAIPPIRANPSPGAGLLRVDGVWGDATDRGLQRALGVVQDGVIGLRSIRALQARIGVRPDGVLGPVTRRALQRHLGVRQDGVWGSATTRALQARLNAGTF